MSKRKQYYTLLEKTPDQLWTPEFGDYDRKIVEQEQDDMKNSGSFIKGTKFKIITSDGTQADLMTKVEVLNVAQRAEYDKAERKQADERAIRRARN